MPVNVIEVAFNERCVTQVNRFEMAIEKIIARLTEHVANLQTVEIRFRGRILIPPLIPDFAPLEKISRCIMFAIKPTPKAMKTKFLVPRSLAQSTLD